MAFNPAYNIPLFQYPSQELGDDEIRLVILKPTQDDHLIDAELVTTKDAPYKALSYTWGYAFFGDKTSRRPILLNGQKFMIGRNLWWALYYIRAQRGGLSIWIDAICINQKNIKERNLQVRKMGRIFAKAEEVLVWLGHEDEDTNIVLKTIKALAVPTMRSVLSMSRNELSKLLLKIEKNQKAQQQNLSTFLGRSYWGRLWIVQEITLAKSLTIHCGSFTLPWEIISQACSRFGAAEPSPWYVDTSLVSAIQQSVAASLVRSRSGPVEGRTLVSLLHIYQVSKAFDSRDMVYGLLGIANDSSCLDVDYSKPPNELWAHMVSLQSKPGPLKPPSITFSGDRLRTMYFSQLLWDILSPQDQNVPSGLVQLNGLWTDQITESGPLGSVIMAARRHTWRGKGQPCLRWNDEFIMKGNALWDLSVFEDFELFISHQHALYLGEDPSAFEKAAKIHFHAVLKSMADDRRLEKAICAEMCNYNKGDRVAITKVVESPNDILDVSNFAPYDFCQFVVTDTGQIGWTTLDAITGDLVCRFQGCDIAVLLRKSREQDSTPSYINYDIVGRIMLLRRKGEKAHCRVGSRRKFQYSVPDDFLLENQGVEVEFSLDTRILAKLLSLQPKI